MPHNYSSKFWEIIVSLPLALRLREARVGKRGGGASSVNDRRWCAAVVDAFVISTSDSTA